MRIYLAGPFFRPEQKKCIDALESCLDLRYGRDSVYSPRRIGILQPDAGPEERARIFMGNVEGLNTANLVVAVADDWDPGTMFEWGYAYSKGVPIIGYSHVIGRGLNVMLTQSVIGFANGLIELDDELTAWEEKLPGREYKGWVF